MKKINLIFLIFFTLFTIGIGNAWAVVNYPHLIFGGTVNTTSTVGTAPGLLTINTTVSAVYYSPTESATTSAQDSIIGMSVAISGAYRNTGSNYSFTDATISIGNGATTLFTASLTDIVFLYYSTINQSRLNATLDSTNPATLNLRNVVLTPDSNYPSRFINDLFSKLGGVNIIGMKLFVLGNVAGDNIGLNIVNGTIDGVPDNISAPVTVRSIGYWKNHIEERDFYNFFVFADALVGLDIFANQGALSNAVTLNGKKTMRQKSEQELAALLLNIEASISGTAALTAGELQILQLLEPAYGTGATINDALFEIQKAIRNNANLENSKDLGEEINNRNHTSN